MITTAHVYNVLKESAQKWPDHIAVYDEFGTITFKELWQETEKLRVEILKSGIQEGMCVGMLARNSRNFIVGMFAVAGCDAVILPISHQMKADEIRNLIEETQLHAILDEGSGVKVLNNYSSTIPLTFEQFHFGFTQNQYTGPFAPHIENPVFMRFTSGTTGKSKGVIISHKDAIDRVEAANKGLELGPDDTVIWVLPMAFHFVVSILLYIRFGAAIAIAKDFLAAHILEISNRCNGTLLYASPLQIKLLAADKSEENFNTLKKVISTSAGIGFDVCAAFKNRFGIDVSQAYGIIEIGLPIINFKKSDSNPDAVGYALPDYTVDILDETFNPLPSGEVGILGIKGPGMFAGYLTPPTTREENLQYGYFVTADFAIKDADGLITVKGREKSAINVAGNKVFVEEVEKILETHPQIESARVSGKAHLLMGQVVHADIILKPNQNPEIEEIISYCRRQLSTYKVPQSIKFVSELPMTNTGKIRRG